MKSTQIRDAYDAWAPVFDETNRASNFPNYVWVESEIVRRVLKVLTPGRALDAASGTGRWAFFLSDCGWSVVSCDQSTAMVDVILQTNSGRADNVECFMHDLNRPFLNMTDECFDLIICSFASCHIECLDVILAEFRRILRDRALLILSDIHPDTVMSMGSHFTITIRGSDYEVPIIQRSVEEYQRLLAEAELRLIGTITAPAVFDVRREAGVVTFFAIR
jgi:SAM-dependent methyltransferase